MLDGTAERAPAGLPRGAYTLVDADSPDLVLIGTGSEVAVAVEAGATLAARGRSVRVVSMPSWDLFERAARRLPHVGAAARSPDARRRSGHAVRLGALRRRRREHRPVRCVGARRRRDARARHHPRARRRARARTCSEPEVPDVQPIKQLIEFGQSPWYDNLTRALATGGLRTLVDEHGIRGVTSNPTIFEKAMASGSDYDAQLREVTRGRRVADRGLLGPRHHRHRARRRHPAPALRRAGTAPTASCRSRSSPDLAHDTDGTIAQAKELWDRLDRPNVMIKIPATEAGIPAIAATLAAGVNVNVTLIFGLDRYARGDERVLRRVRTAHRSGATTSRTSPRSRRSSSAGSTPRPTAVCPRATRCAAKAAVANARLAYQHFLATFAGSRWDALRAKGARVQRPLWASTSTKNPAYSPTLYVDTLIGRDTVNTLAQAIGRRPRRTAYGDLRADTVLEGIDEAHATIAGLAGAGVDFDDVTATLEREGVASFSASFRDAVDTLEKKSRELT